MSERKTSKQKIDEILGIKDDSSVDEFLDDLSLDTEQLSSTFNGIEDGIKQNIESIDNSLSSIQNGTVSTVLALNDINTSLKEVEDLIATSKQMFKHIYNNIIASDLIDSELIGATAKMLEAIHINIAEFISTYKERQRFVDKVKLMVFQQEQKKELMALKHKYDMEKAAQKMDTGAIDAEATSFSQEQIVKMLNESQFESDILN